LNFCPPPIELTFLLGLVVAENTIMGYANRLLLSSHHLDTTNSIQSLGFEHNQKCSNNASSQQ
jgi:hypothetical protein